MSRLYDMQDHKLILKDINSDNKVSDTLNVKTSQQMSHFYNHENKIFN